MASSIEEVGRVSDVSILQLTSSAWQVNCMLGKASIQAPVLIWTNLWRQETHKKWLPWRNQSSMWVCGRICFTAGSICLPFSWRNYSPFPISNLCTATTAPSCSLVSLILTESSIETPLALRDGNVLFLEVLKHELLSCGSDKSPKPPSESRGKAVSSSRLSWEQMQA